MIALVTQLKGGIRPALRYCNSPFIADLHEQTIELVKVGCRLPAGEQPPRALPLPGRSSAEKGRAGG